MITRQFTRILLLTAAVGAAGCSSSSTRFGDFYASAAPQGAVVDNTATGSIAPANSFQNATPASGTPAQTAYTTPANNPQVTRNQLPAASGSTNVVSRMASGVRNMLPRSEPKVQELPRVNAAPARTNPAIAPHARKMRVTVTEGQTLSSLSRRYGVSVDELMKQNGITSADTLRVGQRLVVPAYAASDDPMPVQVASASPVAPVPASTPQPVRKAATVAPKSITPSTGNITVAAGDTLFGISRKTGVPVAKLRKLNGLSGDGVRIGQTLRLPGDASAPTAPAPVETASLQTKTKPLTAPSAPVKAEPQAVTAQQAPVKAPRVVPVATTTPSAADNPVVEAAKPAPEKVETVVASADPVAPPKASTASALRWPVKGRVIRSFGGGSSGLDISAPAGSQIRAAENGTVIYAGSGLKQYGKTVLIQHENGLVTVYGHADTLGVAKGQKVNRGDVIASSGMTGQAETPRVHFQVRKGQTPVDPNTYLR